LAILSTQKAGKDGVTLQFTAAESGGDEFAAGRNRALYVKNGGASELTVTIKSQKPCDQGATHDLTVTVAAGSEAVIGDLEPERFANSDGRVEVSYSDATSVTVAVLEV